MKLSKVVEHKDNKKAPIHITEDQSNCDHEWFMNATEATYGSYRGVENGEGNTLIIDTWSFKDWDVETLHSELECQLCNLTILESDWPGEIEWD